MQFHEHIETSRFKVKEALKFKEHLESMLPEHQGWLDVDLQKEGLKITAMDMGLTEGILSETIQEYLAPKQTVRLMYSLISDAKELENFRAIVITPEAISEKTMIDIFNEMQENIFPRWMKAVQSIYHKGEQVWLEQSEKYLVLERSGTKLIVQHENGKQVACPSGELEDV